MVSLLLQLSMVKIIPKEALQEKKVALRGVWFHLYSSEEKSRYSEV